MKNKKTLILGIFFGLITLASLFIRFWNYQELVNFFGDPPFFLHEVKDMVESGKIRLVGPMVLSKMVMGRGFFTGPFFYYLLAVLGILFNWNAVWMTGFFTLWFIGTFALIFFWLKRYYGQMIALIIYALLSFLPLFVPYSRLIWNPHFLPLFGVLLLWFLEERSAGWRIYLLAGVFFGLGIHFHYGALLWFLIVFYYFISDIRTKSFFFLNWVLFFTGAVLAESPLIFFELRHDFYNLRTAVFQIENFELSAGYTFLILHYYLFPALPLLCKAYAIFLKKLKNIFPHKIIIASQVILILVLLMESLGPKRENIFYPRGWTLKMQQEVVNFIVNDNEENFEVATTINGDTRALDLRWWLRERDHQPLGVEEYNQAVVLYLVAPETRPPEEETVWEVKTLRPFKIAKEVDLGDGLIFYKLRRLPKEELNP